ncbi:zinc finger, CCHC-type containing protein [Tanacetum coccineum]
MTLSLLRIGLGKTQTLPGYLPRCWKEGFFMNLIRKFVSKRICISHVILGKKFETINRDDRVLNEEEATLPTLDTSNEFRQKVGNVFLRSLGKGQPLATRNALKRPLKRSMDGSHPYALHMSAKAESMEQKAGGSKRWNNEVPLRSDTIWLVQNGCSFYYELRFEDPNQHLKDFLKIVDSLDLDVENIERTCLHLFQFSLRNQANNWLECLLVGFISTWEDLTTYFLAQFFPSRRIVKLCNDILMFQQHQGESLSEAYTCFKDLLQKVPHHGIDLWL